MHGSRKGVGKILQKATDLGQKRGGLVGHQMKNT
jgi:hypothetical protein